MESANPVQGLAESIYEQINDDYGYGKLGKIKVVIRCKDGWINGSKLASLKKGKGVRVYELKDYKSLVRTQEIIEKYPPRPNCGGHFFQEITNTELADQDISRDDMKIIQGTYVPADIGIDIAAWVSVEYYIQMLTIVREFTNEQQRKVVAIVERKKAILEGKVLTLEQKLDQMSENAQKATEDAQKAAEDSRNSFKKLSTQISSLHQSVDKYYGLAKNDEFSNEELVIYREVGDPKETCRIRCGTTEYIDTYMKNAINIFRFVDIANAKKALRFAKSEGYLEKLGGNRVVFTIPKAEDRKQVRKFFKDINAKYTKPKTVNFKDINDT